MEDAPYDGGLGRFNLAGHMRAPAVCARCRSELRRLRVDDRPKPQPYGHGTEHDQNNDQQDDRTSELPQHTAPSARLDTGFELPA
jgi:hypothetical protein